VKLVLREFQDDAVQELLGEFETAQQLCARKPQAVLLSAPTGAGKTVMATAFIEELLGGGAERVRDPSLVFLWLTDQPELNKQTLEKMQATTSVLDRDDLVSIDGDFDFEVLSPGRVYFLNTQKLGTRTSFVRHGDDRTWTLWESLQNTITRDPRRFVFIIDEAHRGTAGRDAAEADTIVAKFLRGSVGELDAVPLVVGISATPDRFVKLCGEIGRPVWQVNVDPAAVRESGLIKDVVDLYHPDEDQPSNVTMLLEAVEDWKRYRGDWRQYGQEQDEAVPDPVLLVQVEDARSGQASVSQTDLDLVVRTLAGAIDVPDGNLWIAHAFQDGTAVAAGGMAIRYLAPSEINADPNVQVVLFKTSLNTGWDCPRAEVLVSFRSALDETNIAQLVGRMVRSPLARRIESREFLNSVGLYLPFYNRAAVEKVVKRLTEDSEIVPPTEVRVNKESETLLRREGAEPIFAVLEQLPTYTVARRRALKPISRLAKVAGLLAETGLLPSPVKQSREHLVGVLLEQRAARGDDVSFKRLLSENSVLDIRKRRIDYTGFAMPQRLEAAIVAAEASSDEAAIVAAEASSDEAAALNAGVPTEAVGSIKVRIADQNVNDLFNEAGKVLGEGLHKEYARARLEQGVPVREAKLELAALVAMIEVTDTVNQAADVLRAEWVGQYKAAINAMPEKCAVALRDIESASTDPQLTTLRMPPSVEGFKSGMEWDRHVYVNTGGTFHEDFVKSRWERQVVESELRRNDVVGWFRNPDRKPYSLCFSYRQGERWVPVYPDFVIVRKTPGGLIADIVDPHLLMDPHAPARAAGLAKFAADHSDKFGRIELVVVDGDVIRRLDLIDPVLRSRVAHVSTHAHLQDLFNQS